MSRRLERDRAGGRDVAMTESLPISLGRSAHYGRLARRNSVTPGSDFTGR